MKFKQYSQNGDERAVTFVAGRYCFRKFIPFATCFPTRTFPLPTASISFYDDVYKRWALKEGEYIV